MSELYDQLQSSEEELRTSNEELEATSEELRVSSEELEAANEELLKSELKYSTLFNKIADSAVIFDKKTHYFLDCNSTFQRIYKYSKDELRSMTPYDLHPPEDLKKVKEKIDVRNIDEAFTYTHLTKDGRRMDV